MPIQEIPKTTLYFYKEYSFFFWEKKIVDTFSGNRNVEIGRAENISKDVTIFL